MGPLQRIKDSFVAGLVLVASLAITLYVLTILVNWSTVHQLAGRRSGTGTVVGRHLFGNLGRTVNFVPLVSTIYPAVKRVATSPVDCDSEYESGVLVEYPRESMRMIVTTGIGDNEAELAAQGVPIEGDEPAGAGD